MVIRATMSPHKPRLVLYAQTHHTPGGEPISLLPLLTHSTGVTHVIVAAVHLNDGAQLTLNDDPPSAPKFTQLWSEVATLQARNVPVLAMLGGAAKGTYARLSASFDLYFPILASFIRTHNLSGIDLDVEEPTSIYSIIQLIDALRATFGPSFIITLAPVLTALLPLQPHLSGFSYRILDALRGRDIAWYNVQLYNGWADASSPNAYQAAVACGWDPRRVVLGQLTAPTNGHGFIPLPRLADTIAKLRAWCAGYPGISGEGFGGVMGWEYFNSAPAGEARPWEWAGTVGGWLRAPLGPGPGRVDIPGEPREQQTRTWPEEKVLMLTGLGFTRAPAPAALEITAGDVARAAGWLLEQ